MVEVQPLEDDRYRAFFSPREYELLLDSTPHHRAKPPMKIMALSARVGTAAEVTPGQFLEKNGQHFMRVEGKDASSRYQETKPRNIWFPEEVYDEIIDFVDRHDIDDNEPICDVGKRQLQNWVNEATADAATASGEEDFHKVTAHDFRRYFGTHFLIRLGIDQQIVCQLGGWKSSENMYEYLLVPNDLLVHRLKEQGYTGANPLYLSGINPEQELNANFDTIEKILSCDSSEVRAEAEKRIKNLVERIDGLELTVIQGSDTAESEGAIDSTGLQSSFTGLDDSSR